MKNRLLVLLTSQLMFVGAVFGIDANRLDNSIVSSPVRNLGLGKQVEIAFVGGTTGLGFDVALPLNNMFQLRAGAAFMPSFTYGMDFNVDLNGGEPVVGASGTPSESQTSQVASMLEGLTGTKVGDKVTMLCEPSFYHFNLLVDVFPLKNKKWHLTTGFYWGSSTIGRACNSVESMPLLYAANLFNTIHEKTVNFEPIVEIGDFFIYLDPDSELYEKILSMDRVGMDLGRMKSDGSTYKLSPDECAMVTMEMNVNSFKPYLGFGYGTSSFNSGKKYNFSFDCGVLFWGGAPSIITHDGVDLVYDVVDIQGVIGNYVGIAMRFKAYPVINLRISRRLF